jgi:uncharacterized protein GlcG (DUF336 family)
MSIHSKCAAAVAALVLAASAVPAVAQDNQPVLVNIKRMSLETALKIAQGAIKACRKEGVQIAVTVIDRGAHPQVVLRDVLAPDITVPISRQKAHTALAFNSATSALEGRFKTPFAVAKLPGVIVSAGGLPIHAGGEIVGAVGVSGAPSGKTDESCAKAGIDTVRDDLEMGGM